MLRTLRQPRYAMLAALMLVVALVCVAAGSWQIARFQEKVHENDALRRNAALAPARVSSVLPVVGHGSAPSSYAVQFRTVAATGTYDATHQTLVRSRTVGGQTGFLVVTPLRTSGPTLLVVRGFAPPDASGGPPRVPAPPAGTVSITARAQPPESRNDAFAQLTAGQVESINPGEQASRIGGPVYNGSAQLLSGQPGTRGLTPMPPPNLSNPAGGALEPQHFAYVIQWFLFAILALAAPFAMARAENKLRPSGEVDEQPRPTAEIAANQPAEKAPQPVAPPDPELTPEQRRSAKLADRYGRRR